MKGLISYTLFGDNPIYTEGALKNVLIWKDTDFNVDCRVYVGYSVPGYVRHALDMAGAEVIVVDGPEDQTATFWRYGGLNADYDYFMFRDCDSRPYERELYAVRDWLKSNRSIHIIRDHPFHGVPILAGLFGVKSDWKDAIRSALPMYIPTDFYKEVNSRISGLAEHGFVSNDFYQVDQWWLRLYVYHICRNKIIAHDEFFGWERKMFKAPLPERVNNEFCGEGFDQDDNPRFPEHRDAITVWPKRYIGRK